VVPGVPVNVALVALVVASFPYPVNAFCQLTNPPNVPLNAACR
jgi:hypothetical protein